MSAFRIRPLPRLLGYPMLGATAACLILFGIGALIPYYALAFFPLPLLAAATGVAAAREWNRPAQRAYVGGCLGVMLGSVVPTPFGTHPGWFLAAMCVGLVAGVGLSQRIKR